MDQTLSKVIFLLNLSIQDLNKRIETIEDKIKLFEELTEKNNQND